MCNFQRRHYVKLAEFWKARFSNAPFGTKHYDTVLTMYICFKQMLARDNPNFKESAFDKASGFTS